MLVSPAAVNLTQSIVLRQNRGSKIGYERIFGTCLIRIEAHRVCVCIWPRMRREVAPLIECYLKMIVERENCLTTNAKTAAQDMGRAAFRRSYRLRRGHRSCSCSRQEHREGPSSRSAYRVANGRAYARSAHASPRARSGLPGQIGLPTN